jgi:hypothetical protein
MAYDAGTTCAGMRDRHHSCVCRWNCLGEMSLQLSGVRNRDYNRDSVRRIYFGRAAMKKLRVVAKAVAICAVIAVLAWSKSRAITVVIPYVPHRRVGLVRACPSK